jgi:hypothetical protein
MNSPYRVEHAHDHSPSPDGRIALRVPADVPLGELMPVFLEVHRPLGTDAWALNPAGGEPYPDRSTFAVLGVDDGAPLILHEAAGAAPPASGRARAFPAQPATALVAPQRVCERRLSDRTARTAPVKLSRPARCAMALRAAAHNSSRMNRPCRVRRAGPARPRSLGAHGTRRCRGLELPGRKPATGTGWIRSIVAPRPALRHER